ncbi:MAG: hypothetical protein WBB01_17640 [Phormidesmis sp.]
MDGLRISVGDLARFLRRWLIFVKLKESFTARSQGFYRRDQAILAGAAIVLAGGDRR